MKAPYPIERNHPVLLYQTFAFISEEAYDNIPYIDTFDKLMTHLQGMVNGSTGGRGRRHDFAISRSMLRLWNKNANSSTQSLFDMLIWVSDESDEKLEDSSVITYRDGKSLKRPSKG